MNIPLTLRQLRYIVAVDEQRHFGRAAAACNISQPSLSAQVAQAEEAIGASLFTRSTRRVEPTPAGARLIARARRLLTELEEMVAEAQPTAASLSGAFRLGVIPTLGPYLLPRILPKLRKMHPEVKLYLREDLTDRLNELLARGLLDAALMALPAGLTGMEERPLFDEPFLLATPEDHRLAQRTQVAEGDLENHPVLLLEDGHCFRDQALTVCGRANARQEAFAATSLATLCQMVAGGLGLTLVPALAGEVLSELPGLRLIPFAAPAPSRRIGLVHRRGAGGRAVAALHEFLGDNLPECVTAV